MFALDTSNNVNDDRCDDHHRRVRECKVQVEGQETEPIYRNNKANNADNNNELLNEHLK